MATLHDLMSASIDESAAALGAADASPGDAARGLIARRRRRNAAVAGGTSALAIGGLVVAGLVQGSSEKAPAPASAGPNGIEYVKVDMNPSNAWPGLTDPVVSASCGDTLPAPATQDQNFTQSVAVDPNVSGTNLHVNASLRYDGTDRAPAVINPGIAVLTRDGVIVD